MNQSKSPDGPRYVYIDGEIRLASDASVSIADQGLLYGFGFFETFRTSGGQAHHWAFNQARLETSCARVGLKLPGSFLAGDPVKRAHVIRELLRRCSESDAVFRYTVTGGANHGPTEILTSRPLPASNPSEGICLRVLRLRRDSGEWIPRPKSLNYLNASLGLRELSMRSAAPSDEGLFLAREDDSVVETARQSIAWVVGDRIYTPGESSGAVSGTCLAWLQTCDVAIVRTRAALATFLEANAIFVLNAVRGITPVAAVWDEFDGKQLGSYESAAHPLILQLQRGWNDELAKTAQDCVAS